MNEEEKKAIKMLDKFTTEHKFYNIKHSDNLEDNIEIVLKLIEKLQKENEELKNKIMEKELEIIENEIDIDNIKELYINDKTKSVGEDAIKNWTGRSLDITFANKINEILQAVKQIDKRVKKLERD